jgi:hypothetical protein
MKKGDKVKDTDMNVIGTIKECTDIHNVEVIYDKEKGSGLYCLDINCEEFSKELVFL